MSLSESQWKDLVWLCDQKIWIKPPEEKGPISWAVDGGHYLGAPGKEIFSVLPHLNEETMHVLAEMHADQWPYPGNPRVFKTPGNHVGYAACIRYIYGQFEKQGVLRSEKDMVRMKKQGVDWELPRQFMEILKQKWEDKGCNYGLCIAYEMEGHRIGDEVVVNGDKSKLDEMEASYMRSVEYANKCNSYKQMFTPHYWAAKYFMQVGDVNRACRHSDAAIRQAEAHCPDARGSYVNKLLDCAKYLSRKSPKKWNRIKNLDIQNKCVKKMMNKARKF